ncbi:MAG TPA: 4'-phosphopantetheinyl transferase superfamily protein [Actinomycetota bacterium]
MTEDRKLPLIGERRRITLNGASIGIAWIRPEQLAAWSSGRVADSWLAPEEIAGLEALSERSVADRLASRLALKLLVSEEDAFADVAPGRIAARPGEHGRPDLVVAGVTALMPRISLSHSAGWGAAALCWEGALGIDVQHPRRGMRRVLPRLLAPGEFAEVDDDIVALWVLKEAALKAWGSGLDLPLRDVVVGPRDDAGQATVRMSLAASEWDAHASLVGGGMFWRDSGVGMGIAHFPSAREDI